jgi:hypothetical protein
MDTGISSLHPQQGVVLFFIAPKGPLFAVPSLAMTMPHSGSADRKVPFGAVAISEVALWISQAAI